MATTNLTGAIRDMAGNLLPETDYRIIPEVALAGDGTDVRAGDIIEGTTAATTALIEPVEVLQGYYKLEYKVGGQWPNVRLTCSEADMLIGEAADPALEVTPSIAQAAEAALAAAEASLTLDLVEKTADYTLTASDMRTMIEVNSASDVTITVPADADETIAVGETLSIARVGAGNVEVEGDAGVTIRAPYGVSIPAQWGSLVLWKRAANEWVVSA